VKLIAKAGNRLGKKKKLAAEMQAQLGKDGCDEDEVIENGNQESENNDPNVVDDGGGGGKEIGGDGKDNDGDGPIDEGSESQGNANIKIKVYDSGSAKDDVFALSVSGYGALGVTPKGGLRTYPLSLSPGTYTATVTVISAPDDVGTFTIAVIEGGKVIASKSGSPPQGTVVNVSFTVGGQPDPGVFQSLLVNEFEMEIIFTEEGNTRPKGNLKKGFKSKNDPFDDDPFNDNQRGNSFIKKRK